MLFNGQPFQGQSGEFSAHITSLNKREVIIEIDTFLHKNSEPPIPITLLQGISRGDRMDYTIQKSVELGVSSIIPVLTERSNIKLDAKQLEKKHHHWQRIANSAAEQSGRTIPVNIKHPVFFSQINSYNAELNLLLAPRALQTFNNFKDTQLETLNLLVGPEGGLSDQEINDAQSLSNYQKIALGPRTLRTETAGVTALSIAQYLWGDLT